MSNPAGFGDIEPEDSWDANDPIAAQLHNIRRRLAAILHTGGLTAALRQRLELVVDDLDTVRARIVGDDG